MFNLAQKYGTRVVLLTALALLLGGSTIGQAHALSGKESMGTSIAGLNETPYNFEYEHHPANKANLSVASPTPMAMTATPTPTPKSSSSPTPAPKAPSAYPSSSPPPVVITPQPTSNPCVEGGVAVCGTLPTLTFSVVQDGSVIGSFTLSSSHQSWSETFTSFDCNSSNPASATCYNVGVNLDWGNYNLQFTGSVSTSYSLPTTHTVNSNATLFGNNETNDNWLGGEVTGGGPISETLTVSYSWAS